MVMLCMHKHSLGACPGHHEDFDPHAFIGAHIDLVLRGLARERLGAVPGKAHGRGR
jgi:TetR/AcrR family transcriptional regulator